MKVSVLMVTYNHENFIEKALESALNQKVNFDYEIIVGEDCSTDNTKSKLLEFKKNNPNKLNLIFHDKNIGMHANYEAVLNACNGEYIAALEGDDYWTDESKLQKQVNYLDKNKNITECFHKVISIYEDRSKESHIFPDNLNKTVFNLEDVVSRFFIPTLSIMFRKSAIGTLPPEFYKMKNPDWLLHVLCAKKGDIGFIDDVMGVYRVHSGGVWSGQKKITEITNLIISGNIILKFTPRDLKIILVQRLLAWQRVAINIYIKSKLFKNALLCGLFSLKFYAYKYYLKFIIK